MRKTVIHLVDEAVLSMRASTLEAVTARAGCAGGAQASIGAMSVLQQGQLDLLKQQHEQMTLLKDQHQAHLRLLESQLARAEHVILQLIQGEAYPDEKSVLQANDVS
jgi:hypothetical protein